MEPHPRRTWAYPFHLRISMGFTSQNLTALVLLERRRDPSSHRTETDAVSFALTPAGDDHVVTVLQERALAPACQCQRLLAVPGQFQQATEAIRLRAADRAGAHQV